MKAGEAPEGRKKLLETDASIDLPDKDKGLSFDKVSEKDNYSQSEIDDILKMMGMSKS